jgi:phosphoribosyl 1,2-cyclic phosphodiesterase
MRIKFWGVRGSIPTPERRNSGYGGNTACVEVRLANGTLIILDCGSGLRSLGRSWFREFGDRPLSCHVFLTHFHWDHIQGAPFFLPLYRPENEFNFFAVLRKERDLKEAIEGQMANPYFPVDMTVLRSTRLYRELNFEPIEINGALVRSAPLYHPQEAVAYRIEADGAAFVFATDTEPGSAFHDRSLRELAVGADVLVYDAQYTPEQLKAEKKGWGHSSWLEGTRIAKECGVKQLFLFHHDPDHADSFVDGLVQKARQEFHNSNGAAEGIEFELPNTKMQEVYMAAGAERRRDTRFRLELPLKLAWNQPNGRRCEADAIALDISKSSVHFIAPEQLPIDQTVELEITLPDEVTHSGDLTLQYNAELLFEERILRPVGDGIVGRGAIARLISPNDKSSSYAA